MGKKRKRDQNDVQNPDPPPRRSSRQRRPKSFGEEFEELYSPPKSTPQPQPDPDPPVSKKAVTWPSSEKWATAIPGTLRL